MTKLREICINGSSSHRKINICCGRWLTLWRCCSLSPAVKEPGWLPNIWSINTRCDGPLPREIHSEGQGRVSSNQQDDWASRTSRKFQQSWNFTLCFTAFWVISEITIFADLQHMQDLQGLPGFSYQLKYKMLHWQKALKLLSCLITCLAFLSTQVH